ncbi:MAG: LamG domain-containing protein [Kiritimatiellae bacterium]|nr:LamG domain-containing protein [Kiritimatiellia bacterium]
MKRWIVGLLMLGLAGGVANGENPKGEAEARIALSTQDGSSLVGTPLARGVRIETSFGRSAIPFQVMTRARLDAPEGGMVIEFRNQDRLTGTCLEKWIGVHTAFGVQKVPLDFIREIRVLSPVRADGLLAYYPFDGDADGQVRDASGNGRNGQALGAVFVPDGRLGGAFRVGRRTGYIQIPHDPAWNFADRPFTIALWVKLEGPPYGEQMMIGHDEGGGEQNKWAFEFWNGHLCFHVNTPRSESYRIAAIPWRGEPGQWHHVAVTRSEDRFQIYVDGAWVSEGKHVQPVPAARVPLTIGQAEVLFIEGLLDEIMIFERALPLHEIREIAHQEE